MVNSSIFGCFWQNHIINLNGKPFAWEHHDKQTWDWIEYKPNIHSRNLYLIAYFQEIPLKDYEYEIKAHPVHDTIEIEKINVLNGLIGRIQESINNSLKKESPKKQ